MFIIYCENWHEASFYIKEQTQKNKFEIWVLKTTILDPWKSASLVFEEKHPNKICFGFDSAFQNNRGTNVLLVGIVLKTH